MKIRRFSRRVPLAVETLIAAFSAGVLVFLTLYRH
jgi:hypothetical protein